MAERELRVVYVIAAHQLPAQAVRLIHRLAVPDTAFVVHVDAKSDPRVEREIREGVADVADCVFLGPSHRVYWGGFGVLRVLLRGLQEVRRQGLDPAQTLFITGQDYPVVCPEALAGELEAAADKAFVQHSKLPNLEWWPNDRGGLDRFERFYVRVPRRGMIRTPLRRRVPHGWQPYGGAANVALGRPHRRLVTDLIEFEPRTIRFFRHANMAEEGFVQTALMNSELRDSVVDDNLLFARWQPLANHPDLLTSADLDEVFASSARFARKFDEEADPGVFDAIEARLDCS